MAAQYYNQESKGVLGLLKSDGTRGLTAGDAAKRQEQYGPNELKAKKRTNPLLLFLNQFKSFIIYILIFAVIIAVIGGEYTDATVILAILLFNAFFGFLQEYKAERAIEALKKLSGLQARVQRDGKVQNVAARDLVPGDIILLEEGNKIPADARLLEETLLAVSEASLTGESVPVSKHAATLKGELVLADQKNMLFSGTVVTRGKGKAVVVGTGMQTEIGKIAGLIQEAEAEPTPLQRKLEGLGKWIGIITIAICVVVFFVGVFKDGLVPLLLSGQFVEFIFQGKEWFLTAISLAVAAVPEGLPAIVTIALAIGVRSMVKRNSLIRRLPSVETLGETTVICSDKTGTITMNQMTVRSAYVDGTEIALTGEGYELYGRVTVEGEKLQKRLAASLQQLCKIGILCNDASLDSTGKRVGIIGDPTEGALLVSGEKSGLKSAALLHDWKRVDEQPFDSVRKMMSTVNKDPKSKKEFVFTKGAPEHVLHHCDRILLKGRVTKLTPKLRKEILAKNEEFAKRALRVLGFAYKEKKGKTEEKLIFVGLQGMIDPPHKEVIDAVARCREAGIRVIMITGDNRFTAAAIAHEVGITGDAMDGLDFAKLNTQQQHEAINRTNIFSRVEPSHKMLIVKLLQEKGEIVAMTGDGVNDAPAIKKADLGIAMGITGTDVAKEASDMVLMDDNFTSIVNAVEEGRGIYTNIQKFVNYLLSCNLGEVFVIFFAILLGWPLPMTAIMLLWLNLVTDGLPALALSVDPNPKDLMKQPPKKETSVINKSLSFNILFVSILITIGVLVLFAWGMQHYSGTELFLERIQTIAFTAIIVMELVRLQAIRSEHSLGIFSNKYLVLAVIASILLHLMVIYTPMSTFFGTAPLGMLDWAYILAVSAVVYVLNKIGMALKHHYHWFEG